MIGTVINSFLGINVGFGSSLKKRRKSLQMLFKRPNKPDSLRVDIDLTFNN